MRRRISIWGRVRPSVRPSVRPLVPRYFRRWKVRILGASCAVYPALLDAFSHLYKRVCPSVRLSVCRSVHPSVGPLHTSWISEKWAEIEQNSIRSKTVCHLKDDSKTSSPRKHLLSKLCSTCYSQGSHSSNSPSLTFPISPSGLPVSGETPPHFSLLPLLVNSYRIGHFERKDLKISTPYLRDNKTKEDNGFFKNLSDGVQATDAFW